MNVFEYTNFQQFLQNWLEREKEAGRKLSFENIARQLGLKSKGHAYRIFHDKSMPLASRVLVRLCELIGLAGVERDYFEAMVGFNRAETLEEQKGYLERMGRLAGKNHAAGLMTKASQYLSEWYLPVLREAVTLPGFKGDFKGVAKMFRPAITESQAKKGVKLLVDLDLLQPIAGGRYKVREEHVHAAGDVDSVTVAAFQQKMMARASDALGRETAKDREITTLTFSYPSANFLQIKKALRRLQNELIQEILKEKTPGDCVYQFNMQCFPVFREEA